jgi:dihydrofolate reductase
MRTITVAEFMSLDGVVESPERWHMSYVDEEMMAAMFPADSDADTLLLGRRTYDSFAGAFANAPQDDPVAARMTGQTKIVVTSTPDTVVWKNSVALTARHLHSPA